MINQCIENPPTSAFIISIGDGVYGLPPYEDGAEEGLRCLNMILKIEPITKIIIITGNNDRGNALKAVQMGAYDFYQKPMDIEELRVTVKRAFYLSKLEAENRRLHLELERKGTELYGMVGQCPAMLDIFSTIRKVASSDVSVLVIGESGTGKEMVARAIHSLSLRKERPFIPINCSAIPENLRESEFSGYEKGALRNACGTPKCEEATGRSTPMLEQAEAPAASPAPTQDGTPILSVRGLNVAYGESRVLFDVALEVAPCRIVAWRRTQRRRQDHAAEEHRRLPQTTVRVGHL